jgi:hypothetical protein
MIEAYKVGISLLLDSNVQREMGAIGRQFEQLDRIVKGVQRGVNELAAGMRGLSRIGDSAAAAWTTAAQAMERAARAAERAGKAMPFPGGGYGGGSSGAGPRAQPSAATTVAQYYLGQRTAMVSVGPRGLAPYGGGAGDVPLLSGPRPGGAQKLLSGPGGIQLGPVPPRYAPGTGGIGPLAEQFATFLAVRESMQEDVALRSALLSMGFKPGDADFGAGLGRLRGLASSS